MKKFIIIGFLVALIAGLAIFFAGNTGERYSTDPNDANAYLRVHIRANSNSAEDQEVKYKVRDEVVSYLTPIVAECTTKEEAIEKIGANLDGATRVAEATLKNTAIPTAHGRASVKRSFLRVYIRIQRLRRACTTRSYWNSARAKGITGGAWSIRRSASAEETAR